MFGIVYPSHRGPFPHMSYFWDYTSCPAVVVDGQDLQRAEPTGPGIQQPEPAAQACGRGPREQLVDQWNRGLRIIRDANIELAFVTDSAFAPTPGWFEPMVEAIREEAWQFLGPVTNRPGAAGQQWAGRWIDDYRDSDANEDVKANAESLGCLTLAPQPTPLLGEFCMAGLIEDWFRYAADDDNVFDPRVPAEHAATDFFCRAKSMGAKLAIVPQSFVFVMDWKDRRFPMKNTSQAWELAR